MSKGLGEFQHAIIDALRQGQGSLLDVLQRIDGGEPSATRYGSGRRAIRTLVERGDVLEMPIRERHVTGTGRATARKHYYLPSDQKAAARAERQRKFIQEG